MSLALIIVVLLGLLMLSVGIFVSRKIKSSEDYYLAGRNLGSLVSISTQCASFVGGGMTLGWIGASITYGFAGVWYGALQALSYFFMGIFMVRLLRKRGTSFISLPDWFDNLYHSKPLNIAVAVFCILAPITWITGQFTAAARMLEGIGIDYMFAVIFVGGIVILYSVVGGFLAVVYTDTIQWLLLLAIFVGTIPFAVIYGGGIGEVWANTPETMKNLFLPNGQPPYTIFLWTISGLVAATGMQYTYQRIISAKSDRVAYQSVWTTGIVTVLFAIVTAFVGLAVYTLGLPAGTSADGTWPWFLSTYMPDWVSILYTVCIMMATMSTADTLINSISLNVTYDLYAKYINPQADDKKVLKVGVIVSSFFGLLALFWATGGAWMLSLFGYANTLCAGPLSGAIFAAVFLKERGNWKCLLTGSLCGSLVGLITMKTSLGAIPSGGTVFSFGTSLLICLVGSLILGSSNKDAAAFSNR